MDHAREENKLFYDYIQSRKKFINGSPHLKHDSLKKYYLSLVKKSCTYVKSVRNNEYVPRVLDLGAGDGTATLSFMMEGCTVTAVDISVEQLNRFKEAFPTYVGQCDIICGDVNHYIENMADSEKWDIIVFNAFLHHIPDYMSLIKKVLGRLKKNGVLFTFQDPIFYTTLPKPSLLFSKISFFSWRITQDDVFGGIKRRLQRNKGDFSDPISDVEYHVVRDGVNQCEIMDLLKTNGFSVEYYPYFSTQASLFQMVGTHLGFQNNFGIIAKR